MTNKNISIGQIFWLSAGFIMLACLIYAFLASPFVNSTGPFANFQKARAIPAALSAISGTLLILLWGFGILKRKHKDKAGTNHPSN